MALSYRISPIRAVASVDPRRFHIRSTRQVRVTSIDVARGVAMVFVCLSHFSTAYLTPLGHASATYALTVISMVASPSFIAISGMVAGFLAATRPETFPRIRIHLIDRGLFLLTVGHAVLSMASLSPSRSLLSAANTGYITDVIGITIIVGPSLIAAVPAWRRAAIAVGLYAAAWLAVVGLDPTSSVGLLTKHFLFGVPGAAPPGHGSPAFPLVPWFAVYLLGTLIGERFGAEYSGAHPRAAKRVFGRVGLAALMTGLSLFAAARAIRARGVTSFATPWILRITSPTQKFPPGLVYLLFFGGAGLLAAYLMLCLERRRGAAPVIALLRNLGYASLFVYLLQAFVYSTIARLSLPYSPAWPLLYLATMALLGAAAWLWRRIDGNRFFTVGLTAATGAIPARDT